MKFIEAVIFSLSVLIAAQGFAAEESGSGMDWQISVQPQQTAAAVGPESTRLAFTGLPVAEELMRLFGKELQAMLDGQQTVDEMLDKAQKAWEAEF